MTSTSRLSRNWNAGKILAETGSISYNNQDGVAEGVYTSKALREFFETNDLVEFASEHFKILLDLGYMIHGVLDSLSSAKLMTKSSCICCVTLEKCTRSSKSELNPTKDNLHMQAIREKIILFLYR
jgi:hypothetical protein